jgi:hypothetical protein
MIKVPLKLIPPSFNTPYLADIYLFMSAINGISIGPSPP